MHARTAVMHTYVHTAAVAAALSAVSRGNRIAARSTDGGGGSGGWVEGGRKGINLSKQISVRTCGRASVRTANDTALSARAKRAPRLVYRRRHRRRFSSSFLVVVVVFFIPSSPRSRCPGGRGAPRIREFFISSNYIKPDERLGAEAAPVKGREREIGGQKNQQTPR